jgi:hypothetical protein
MAAEKAEILEAVRDGDCETLMRLYAYGADLFQDCLDTSPSSAAHIAAEHGKVAVLEILHHLRPDLINSSKYKRSPLETSMQEEVTPVTKALLAMGGEKRVNTTDPDTLFHTVVLQNNVMLFDTLMITEKHRINNPNHEGKTPFDVLQELYDIDSRYNLMGCMFREAGGRETTDVERCANKIDNIALTVVDPHRQRRVYRKANRILQILLA